MKRCHCCGKISEMKTLYLQFYVECYCGMRTKRCDTKAEAERIWNRRAENQLAFLPDSDNWDTHSVDIPQKKRRNKN